MENERTETIINGNRPKTENEKIGNVCLDYSMYPGEDLYCDGEVEGEILEEVRRIAYLAGECTDPESLQLSEYSSLIEKKMNWPFLYHISPIRENIVSWLPVDKTMKILEVGSGCGAITGALSRMGKSVECVDLSRQRSLINAYRHRDCDNVIIHVGNFQDIEPGLASDFDLICLIGVFEYGKAYIGGKTPYETFLNILKKHLAPGGSIAIAIENKFGLKYFAGCKEDHVGRYFEGIVDYPGESPARTFTKRGLLEIAGKCGFSPDHCHMYYPYPDYKFMHTLFSDERLPQVGELKDNLRNFDRDRLYLFDEKLAFDNIIREGEFPLFSNSYMLILGEKPDISYARFSNDRADDSCIMTGIGPLGVTKRALTKKARGHLEKMVHNHDLLSKTGGEDSFIICPCRAGDDGGTVSFPLIEGKRLEELLDERLLEKDKEGFISLFKEYFRRVKACEGTGAYDLDLIFSNILVSDDRAVWTAIDYEWVTDEPVSAKEIAYRALYCYMLEDPARQRAESFGLMSVLGVSPAEEEKYRADELIFQKKTTGGRKSLAELRSLIGNEVIDVTGRLSGVGLNTTGKLKVYYDDGSGFSEERTFFPERTKDGYLIEITGLPKLCELRLDPWDHPCIVRIGAADGILKKITETSGLSLGNSVYAFGTDDPYFVISMKGVEAESITVTFDISPVTESVAGAMSGPKERNIFEKIGRKLKG